MTDPIHIDGQRPGDELPADIAPYVDAFRRATATPSVERLRRGLTAQGFFEVLRAPVRDARERLLRAAVEESQTRYRDANSIVATDLHNLATLLHDVRKWSEAEALYLKFRGRMPGVEALLKGRGLSVAA